MRESIGGTWLLGIMLVFIVFFIAYVAVSLNYSKAYRLKTEMITIMQQYEGPNRNSFKKIKKAMSNYGYTVNLSCKNHGSNLVTIKNSRRLGSYCLKKETKARKTYYTITIGFSLSLPLFGNLFTFRVSGETDAITHPRESVNFNLNTYTP